MNKLKRIFQSSQLTMDESLANDFFMYVKVRLFSTKMNRNGVAVTAAFIEDIVTNKSDYVGLPLYANTTRLEANIQQGLDHMYNETKDEFSATMIGSFYDFEAVEDEFGTSLIGLAKIAKRNKKICETMQAMYDKGNLKFSFEVAVGKQTQAEDGTCIVDQDPSNKLIGMAVVSIPAYPEAVALMMVAGLDINVVVEALMKVLPLNKNYWVETINTDWVDFRESDTQTLIRVEYDASGETIAVKDVYEVSLQRKETDPMLKNKDIKVEASEDIEVAETVEPVAEVAEAAAEINEPTVEPITEPTVEVSEIDDTEETNEEDEKDKLIRELKEENERLKKAELEKAEQAKTQAEAQSRVDMTNFAKDLGIELSEDLSGSIEALDYKSVLAEIMKNFVSTQVEESSIKISSYADISLEDSKPYNGILESYTN